MIRRLWSETVWAKGALDKEPRKYRNGQRVWLPLYDLIALTAGVLAATHGSLLLDRLYGEMTDLFGIIFGVIAAICFLGVAFPKLWLIEMICKCLLLGAVSLYIAGILGSPSSQQLLVKEAPNYFVACMLLFGFPLPMWRLNILADELYDRRVARRTAELLAEASNVE